MNPVFFSTSRYEKSVRTDTIGIKNIIYIMLGNFIEKYNEYNNYRYKSNLRSYK